MSDEGKTILAWRTAGFRFHIVKLRKPRKVGAGDRKFRLYCDNEPAFGGQWHYTLESALARAEYMTKCRWVEREAYLLRRVHLLEHRIMELVDD